jgi:integrase
MSKSEAKRKFRAWLEEHGVNSDPTLIQAVKPGKTFAEQAEWWEQNKLALGAETTQESRGSYLKTHLIPYFGQMAVSVIGEKEAQEFITHLTRNGLKPRTVESVVATLKRILGKKAWRDWSLTLPAPSDEEQRYFTPEEMLQIIDDAKGKWRPYFALLSETGLRNEEGAGLYVEDIDTAGCKITVRRAIPRNKEGPTKTQAGRRVIDVSPELAQILRDHIAGRTTGRVFETKNGRPLDKDNVRHALHRILARLKLPRGGSRAFRHGRVSILKENRVDPDLLKIWIGHANTRTAGIYTHFQKAYCQSEAQRVGILPKQPAQVEPELPFGPKKPTLDPSLQRMFTSKFLR